MLLLTFPYSFFFSRIYTESLFFLLILLLMYGFKRGIKCLIFIASLLLPLSRPQGVIIGLAVFFMYIFEKKRRKLFVLSFLGFLMGSVLYLLIMYFSTGDILAALHAQSLYPRVNPIKMLINPYRWLKENFIYPSYALRYLGIGNFINERIIFLFFLLTLIFGKKYLLLGEYILLITLGLFSALTDHFMSFSRFLLPLFPFYIVLWGMLRNKKILYYLVLTFFVIDHFLLLTLHSLSYFVG